nr:hypothetical protein DO63_5803 [Burkholderia pseudomallei]
MQHPQPLGHRIPLHVALERVDEHVLRRIHPALAVPHQKDLDVEQPFLRRQPPEPLAREVVAHDVLGQAADAVAREHEAADFIEARRCRDDAPGEAALIAEHGERRERVADLVAREGNEILGEQILDFQRLAAE